MPASSSGTQGIHRGPSWYAVRTVQGRERAVAARLRAAVSPALLSDAFCIEKERWMKRQGRWRIDAVPLYRGYLFVETGTPRALARALARGPERAEMIGSVGNSWCPLPDGTRAWLDAVSGPQRIIRSSTAEIVQGRLRVLSGPLVGREHCIERIDRHRRRCLVRVPGPDGGRLETMPIDVPVKR